jgi:hypothetical protein
MTKNSSTDDNCVETVHDSKIKVEEHGRKAVFLNQDRREVRIVSVDGCLISGASPRADFILSKPTVVDVIVELKGKDIFHAKEQIMATLLFWSSHPPYSQRIAGLIICSRSPATSSVLQVMKQKARRNGILLVIEESGRREYSFDAFQ